MRSPRSGIKADEADWGAGDTDEAGDASEGDAQEAEERGDSGVARRSGAGAALEVTGAALAGGDSVGGRKNRAESDDGEDFELHSW